MLSRKIVWKDENDHTKGTTVEEYDDGQPEPVYVPTVEDRVAVLETKHDAVVRKLVAAKIDVADLAIVEK